MSTTDPVIDPVETLSFSFDLTRFFRGRVGVLGFHARNLACYAIILTCASAVGSINEASKVSGVHDYKSLVDYGTLVRVLGWSLIGLALAAVAIIFINLMRRLNDLDFRRWWILLTFVPPVTIFLHLWLFFWPGSSDVNRFGHPPLPGQFERAIGCIGLGVMVIMISVSMAEMATKQTRKGQTMQADPYEAALARFTSGRDRAIPILDEATFRERIVEKIAFFLGKNVDAPMTFRSDGTLLGSFTQHGGEPDDADLLWHWHDDKLCREGRVGRSRIPRACGKASVVPDAGLIVEYDDASSTERWLLSERALRNAAALPQ